MIIGSCEMIILSLIASVTIFWWEWQNNNFTLAIYYDLCLCVVKHQASLIFF